METIDCVVVGAGVIGLAIARALGKQGRRVIVLESQQGICTQTSSRNSGVIHSGIYYPSDSYKAQLCVRGKQLLLPFLRDHHIPHQLLGKLVLALNKTQHERLIALHKQAKTNGVLDVHRLTGHEVQALESNLQCYCALLSESSGILDSYAYALALHADCEALGVQFAFCAPFLYARVHDDGLLCAVGGQEPCQLHARLLINAAGLASQMVSRSIRGVDLASIPPRYLAKGSYFRIQGGAPFTHLIYPLPVDGGLGIHFTPELHGSGRFGPDVEWVTACSYDVDSTRSDVFYDAIGQYYPDIKQQALYADSAGIRPKVVGPGADFADFIIQNEHHHHCPGLIALYGIESPGLTASLAIAELVSQWVQC